MDWTEKENARYCRNMLIKALQNYDKYTILNPLEVNLH